MKALPARYAAWCRRQGTMRCHPAGAFLAVMLVAAWMLWGGITREVSVHKTGLEQIAAGTGAVLACLAAAGLAWAAMRIVDATPVPATAVPETVPTSRKPATITALTLTPEDAAEMAADADALADGTLDLTFTERGSLFELREPEDAS